LTMSMLPSIISAFILGTSFGSRNVYAFRKSGC
jgi:hypothetical protein